MHSAVLRCSKHCERRDADAQIIARLQNRQNVVEVGRRRQPEDHVRQRVLMWAGSRATKQKQDDHISLAERSFEAWSTALDGVNDAQCGLFDCRQLSSQVELGTGYKQGKDIRI